MKNMPEVRRNPFADRKRKHRRWEARRKIGPYAWTIGYGRTKRGAVKDLARVERGDKRRKAR